MKTASNDTSHATRLSSGQDLRERIRSLFARETTAISAQLFVDGLLTDERRKNGRMRAEAAGDRGPWRQQALLDRSRWNADALRDLVREYVIEHFGDRNAVLVINETGFLKQGGASCGVERQSIGSTGRIANCQVGVFGTYVSRQGAAFIDRALYLPKSWTDDLTRLRKAAVPEELGFTTKRNLTSRMISHALAASVPFRWVTAGAVCGEAERQLQRAGKGYVLDVEPDYVVHPRHKPHLFSGSAAAIAATLKETDWQRHSTGGATVSLRQNEWCHLELDDLHRGDLSIARRGITWTRGLLIRRRIIDGKLAFFSTLCPMGTPNTTLIEVQCCHRAVETIFETAKRKLGLDHNETRSWHGWHRHVSLVMLAFAIEATAQQGVSDYNLTST